MDNISWKNKEATALQLLPEYMIPTNYIRLNEFPILPSGKIDKQKIFPPEGSWEQFRDNNAPVLPLIGREKDIEIYDMGCGKVIKRYPSAASFGSVWNGFVSMQKAYESGLSVPKAYAIVRFGSDYGILTDKAALEPEHG